MAMVFRVTRYSTVPQGADCRQGGDKTLGLWSEWEPDLCFEVFAKLLVPVLVMVLVHFTLSDLSLALQSQGQYQDILSPKKYKNCSTDSKVTAIFLNLWILPVGGVALGRVCTQPVEQACLSTKSFL